eukprot:GILJ01010797.1.p1 GENE.GILJ01010797.1~~GILJ01010797.1.p1  ORF type:complete len:226 (+),score=16.69 GILJ01010797.1:42-719(+)
MMEKKGRFTVVDPSTSPSTSMGQDPGVMAVTLDEDDRTSDENSPLNSSGSMSRHPLEDHGCVRIGRFEVKDITSPITPAVGIEDPNGFMVEVSDVDSLPNSPIRGHAGHSLPADLTDFHLNQNAAVWRPGLANHIHQRPMSQTFYGHDRSSSPEMSEISTGEHLMSELSRYMDHLQSENKRLRHENDLLRKENMQLVQFSFKNIQVSNMHDGHHDSGSTGTLHEA